MPIIDVKDAQFPVLNGSEKQVEWANKIRRGHLATFELEIVWGQQSYVLEKLKKAAVTVDDLRARIFSETSAHVWIEILEKANRRSGGADNRLNSERKEQAVKQAPQRP